MDDHFLAIGLDLGALGLPPVFLGLLPAAFVFFLDFGAFGFDPDLFAEPLLAGFALADFLDGVAPFAGDVDGWAARASTFGGSATGADLTLGALGVFGALAFVVLVLGAFGLLADLALDLLADLD